MSASRQLVVAAVLVLAVVDVSRARAQTSGGPSLPASSLDSTAAGVRAGRALAGERGVARYFGLGLVSMTFIGVAAPFAIDDRDGPQIAMATTGGVLLGLTLLNAGRASVPPALEQGLVQHDPSYVRGFREGYQERLGQRRRRAAAVGGVTGVLVAAGALALLLSAYAGGT